MRQTLGTPDLIPNPAYMAGDIAVRWDIAAGCMVSVELNADDDQPLRIRVAVGPDFPLGLGRELRATSPDQLRRFACQLIALAEHADRPGGVL